MSDESWLPGNFLYEKTVTPQGGHNFLLFSLIKLWKQEVKGGEEQSLSSKEHKMAEKGTLCFFSQKHKQPSKQSEEYNSLPRHLRIS